MENKNNVQVEVGYGTPKEGETLPLYGIITEILEENGEGMVVALNNQIKLQLNFTLPEDISLIKDRMFEPGIFISNITLIKDEINLEDPSDFKIEALVQKVIFGRKQSYNC